MKKRNDKLSGESLNITQKQLEKITSAIPEVVTDGKIDWEKLQATLGKDNIEFSNERYVLNWAGKSEAFKVLQQTTTATLKPVKEESLNFENTENVFIEGENLEVLKLLQKSYFEKIKCIIIDPPYNTGNDSFIYPDSFKENKEDYEKRIGERDEEGYLMKEGYFRKNSKDNGHYHSNWLSMMYPRLFLAKNLLRDDGVIFVHIDDNEVHNLRLIMNEIFGEENFVDCIIWKKRYGGGAKEKYLVSMHEYSLFYSKNISNLDELFVPLDEKNIEKYYKLKDNNFEKRGPYRTHPLEAGKAVDDRPNLIFPIIAPDGTKIIPERQWYWSQERISNALNKGEIEFVKGKKGWTVHSKQYLRDENGELRQGKAFSIIDDVFTQHGTNEMIDIFGNAKIFPYPKPSNLIIKFLRIATDCFANDLILDFFGGSGTTAHSVIEQNKDDGGNRKFILVQLPELCDNESEAFKAGYKTIADIGKERIRRVIKKIEKEKTESPELIENNQLDLGFKVFKLAHSNFKIWRGNEINENNLESNLDIFTNPVKDGSKKENMLYEIMLKAGCTLTDKVEYIPFESHKNKQIIGYYSVNNGDLIIALDKINQKIVDKIISSQPQKVITLDNLFAGNDQLKTNTVLQMKDAEIDFKTI